MTGLLQPTTALLPLRSGDPQHAGPYRIVGRLGVGGMGVVFAGVDLRGARVAVKVIHASLSADAEFRARFAREVSVLDKVKGTCVVRIIDADVGAAQPWLAAEYVPGPTLESRVTSHGPLHDDELFGLTAGLAEALVAVHAAGVVHRDLKPSNVILSPAGPKLVDFGIARALDATVMTRTGTWIGSPGWVSPEEYSDAPTGPAADVYGWGLLVVYAATGSPPYGVARPEVLALKVLHEAVATSAVPGPLRTLVDRTLAKDPGLRPSASEVMAVVAESWRERHAQPAIAAADAATDIIARLDRTWVMPAAEPAWPTVQPSAPAAGTRRAALIAATVVIVLGAATAIAVNKLPAQPNPPPVQARSAAATADTRASQAATGQRDPAPKRTDRRPSPPPGTSAELAAALDLALASTPAASFTFEGGFTQSLTGGKASGRLHNRETQDDFDMTIRSYEGFRGRYVVLRSSSVYPDRPRAKADDLQLLGPEADAWNALIVAGTAGPSVVREMVAHGSRMKRKGRTYSGAVAVADTSGPLRALLNSWLDGDVEEVQPDSYITYKLTIDADDRPKRFLLAWSVPLGNGGIYTSTFSTSYRGWNSRKAISQP